VPRARAGGGEGEGVWNGAEEGRACGGGEGVGREGGERGGAVFGLGVIFRLFFVIVCCFCVVFFFFFFTFLAHEMAG